MVIERQQANVHAQVEGVNEVQDDEQGDDEWTTDEEEQDEADEREKPVDVRQKNTRTPPGTSGIAV